MAAASLAAGATLLAACASRSPIPTGAAPIPLDAVPYQWGIGGGVTTTIAIDDAARAELGAIFTPMPADAREERRRIARAVALFEREAGRQTPAWNDKPRGTGAWGDIGQLDCVDESTNTTTFLVLLRERGWLAHHDVLPPRWRTRGLVFDPHRTARIVERETGERFAVDSWVGAAGEAPAIQREAGWARKDPPPREPE